MKTFGERLRYVQNEILKMNDVQLASILGVDKSTIKSIVEIGSTNIKNIVPLKTLYNIDLNWLLCGDGDIYYVPGDKDKKDLYYKNVQTENIVLRDSINKFVNAVKLSDIKYSKDIEIVDSEKPLEISTKKLKKDVSEIKTSRDNKEKIDYLLKHPLLTKKEIENGKAKSKKRTVQ